MELNKDEINVLLARMNITKKPSYHHEDYITRTIAIPYPLEAKLNRLKNKYKISRSAVIRMLLESIEE